SIRNAVIDVMNSSQSDIVVLAKGAGVALFGKIFGRALQLVVQVLLARLLGPMQYGLYVLGFTVLQIGQQVGLLGLDNGAVHFGGQALQRDQNDLPAIVRATQLVTLGSALAVGLLIFLLAPWFSIEIIHQPQLVNVLRGFSLAVVFAAELRVTSAITRLSRKTQFSVLSEDILPYLVSLGLIVLFAYWLKLSVTSAVWAVVAGFGAGWALALFFIRRLSFSVPVLGPVPVPLARKLLLYSSPIFFSIIFVYLLYGATVFMLGYYHSPQEVGIYQAASQISTLSVVILLAFNAIFGPMISRLNEEAQRPQLDELYKVSTKWALYASLPFLLILLLMPHQVLQILYGAEYAGGAWTLVILTLAQAVNTATGAVGLLLVMHHHQNRWLLISGTSLLAGLLLDIWLIPRWGMTGAAIANACSIAILYLLALFQVRSLLRLWPYDRRYWKGTVAAIGSAAVILADLMIFPGRFMAQLVAATLSGMIVFLFLLWLLRFDQEDSQIFKFLLSR
ncbi:MAG: flippase, partial [Chloroflexota bacterium]